MKKIISLVVICLVAVGCLVGCGKKEEATTTTIEETTTYDGQSYSRNRAMDMAGEDHPEYTTEETTTSKYEPDSPGLLYDDNIMSFTNSIGTTYYLMKVDAYKEGNFTLDVIVTDANGSVVGLMEDTIYLSPNTSGMLVVNDSSLDEDLNRDELNWDYNCTYQKSYINSSSSCIEITDYNASGDYLYISAKKTTTDSTFMPEVQVLFYNNGTLVDYDYTFFEGLDSVGDETIAKIWTWGIDYTDVEFYIIG